MAGNSNINNDPFEEFEFKPINEGLGFHKKAKTQTATTTMNTGMTNGMGATSTQMGTTTFAAPLPRPEMRSEARTSMPPETRMPKPTARPTMNVPTIEDDSIAKAQTAVNQILRNLNQKRQLDFVGDNQKIKTNLKTSKPFMLAASLDAMLIIAAFLLSMIAMLTITKIDLFMNLTHAETSRFVFIATGGLFIAITFIYMVVNRAFMGYTPGEWACDQRCGQDTDMDSAMYIPRIILRTLIVMGTGFITMPLISFLMNQDVAGKITGLNLYKTTNA